GTVPRRNGPSATGDQSNRGATVGRRPSHPMRAPSGTRVADLEHLPGAGTLPGLVYRQSQIRPNEVALRQKDLGIWRPTTWAGYFEAIRAVGLALHALNIRAGDRVGIIAENEPAWLFADLGAQGIGALSVAAYPTQVAS